MNNNTMNKILIFSMMVSLLACNPSTNDKKTAASTTDTTKSVEVPTVNTNVLQEELAVTPFEMKDDSVFTDGSIPTSWQVAGIDDVAAFKLFLKQLQLWIMDNDKEKLATAIQYPLKNIKTPEELIQHYDAVFTKDVKLSFATINFNQIFRNAKGAMTEGGKVWFAPEGKTFKIIAINY